MNATNSSEAVENICVVCFRTIHLYSAGDCDHPVCYECSTRMRVLCRQNECPICRQDMPKVIFTHELKPFRLLRNNIYTMDKKFKICFEDDEIQKAFHKLLEHVCTSCKHHPTFRNFSLLKDHMRKEHQLFYCEICVENIKVFTWERQCYTRSKLAEHRRKGDVENTSHRGHPLCQFCEQRYMDSDELYRHLRREHFFCHFCDADDLHQYYSCYEELREHFHREHYLCEEGECQNEKFTSAFRTEIDLKAHRAKVHSKLLSKAAAKQARTLELEFRLASWRREGDKEGHHGGARGRGKGAAAVGGLDREDDFPEMDAADGRWDGPAPAPASDPTPEPLTALHSPAINMNSTQEFPTLKKKELDRPGASGLPSQLHDTLAHKLAIRNGLTVQAARHSKPSRPLSMSEENFPSLGSSIRGTGRAASVVVTTPQSPVSPDRVRKTLTFSVNSHEDQARGGAAGGSGAKRGGHNFSIQVSHSQTPGVSVPNTHPAPFTQVTKSNVGKSQARITKVSTSQNITLQPNSDFSSRSQSGNCRQEEAFTLEDPVTRTGGQRKTSATSWSGTLTKPSAKNGESQSRRDVSHNMSSGTRSEYIEDFPCLSSKNKKASSVTIPMSNTWSRHTTQPGVGEEERATKSVESDTLSGASVKGKSKKKKQKGNISENIKSFSPVKESASNSEPNKKKKKQLGDSGSHASNKKNSVENQENEKPLSAVKEKNPVKGNEPERKRSEIRIGALKNQQLECVAEVGDSEKGVFFDAEDFPSLTGKPTNGMFPGELSCDPKSSLTRPPPGFGGSSKQSSGFFVTLNSVARSPNVSTNASGLTFTNSSGESYSVVPKPHVYMQPVDFSPRNKTLVCSLKELVTDEVFHSFRKFSSQFRNGTMSAEDYYHQCGKLMNYNVFMKIFSELLVLLPDIPKQQELLAVHNSCRQNECLQPQFVVCAACQQVLVDKDFSQHISSHSLETDFPSLPPPTALQSSAPLTWGKK